MWISGYIHYQKLTKPLKLPGLTVEIGFGNGEFLVKLAKEHPHRYFLGIEVSGIAMEKLLKRIRTEDLQNLFAVRLDAYWAFLLLLEDESVETIYLNYPDPWFKKRHHKRRLTHSKNLYLFARRLVSGGQINLRTDDKPFLDYTLKSAEQVGAFEIEIKTLSPGSPLTKYEAKWMREGKTLYALKLKKVGFPREVPHPRIQEVEEVFPVKVPNIDRLGEVLQREFRLEEHLVLRTFRVWRDGDNHLLEVLLSEAGFVQRFMIYIRSHRNGYYILDVSSFSEILKTRGVQKALEYLARKITSAS